MDYQNAKQSNGCRICPIECGTNRALHTGVCGAGGLGEEPAALVARAARHYYEEPYISGESGSGAVFFSGCNLRCIFCQNMSISSAQKGIKMNAEELMRTMLRLQSLGSHNINLVTPSVHVPLLLKAIPLARREGLTIPIVYNTNSYEKVETIKSLEGLIDIYLPDLKYVSRAAAGKYSGRADYFDAASKAVLEMHRQVGVLALDEKGHAQRGLLIRHLVLPGSIDEARGVLDFIHENLPPETYISLMGQYTPLPQLTAPLNRRLLAREYNRAVDYAVSLGFSNVLIQSSDSAKDIYTPCFDGFIE